MQNRVVQTVTKSIESDAEPECFRELLADAMNIPKWASAFADSIAPKHGALFTASKGEVQFDIEVVEHPSANAIDYLRELPQGRRGGAYMRVLPRPQVGTVIVMTIPIPPGDQDGKVALTLEEELSSLVRLVDGASNPQSPRS